MHNLKKKNTLLESMYSKFSMNKLSLTKKKVDILFFIIKEAVGIHTA